MNKITIYNKRGNHSKLIQPPKFNLLSEKSPEQHAPLLFVVILYFHLGMPPIMLQHDVTTRWNSMFCVLESLLEQTWAHTVYSADYDQPVTFSALPWGLIENIISLLSPFEEITREMSASVGFADDTLPSVIAMKFLLNKLKLTMELVWKDSFISVVMTKHYIRFCLLYLSHAWAKIITLLRTKNKSAHIMLHYKHNYWWYKDRLLEWTQPGFGIFGNRNPFE